MHFVVGKKVAASQLEVKLPCGQSEEALSLDFLAISPIACLQVYAISPQEAILAPFPLKFYSSYSFPLPSHPQATFSSSSSFLRTLIHFFFFSSLDPSFFHKITTTSTPASFPFFTSLTAHCTFPPGSRVHSHLLSDYPRAVLSPVTCVHDHPIAQSV